MLLDPVEPSPPADARAANRSWPNRSALLVELMLELAAEAAPSPTGTDPLHAIRTEVRMVAEAAGELSGRLFPPS